MSVISDVREEIKNLDSSSVSLKKFGVWVGVVFMFISVFLFFRTVYPAAGLICGLFAAFLILSGIIYSPFLKRIYIIWMTAAFTLGWFMSRLLLSIIFFVIITPTGLVLRIFKKDLMNIRQREERVTYWIKRDTEKKIDYEKMY